MSEWKKHDGSPGIPAGVQPEDHVQFHVAGEAGTWIEQATAFAWRGVVAYRVISMTPPSFDSKPQNPKDAIATNKLPTHLVSGLVKAYDAIAHFLGNVKYGSWNFRAAPVRVSVYKSALDRHMDAYWEGEWLDPTDGTPHLANAKACINILIEAHHTPGTIDDRPPSRAGELRKVRDEFEALMPKIRARYEHMNPHHFTQATDPAPVACPKDCEGTK